MPDDLIPQTTAPPQTLRFVVANDPNQFRDRLTMRSNRSHVMHNHLIERRYEAPRRANVVERSRVQKRTRSITPSRNSSQAGSPSLSQGLPERSSREQLMSSTDALAIYRRVRDPVARRRATATSDAEAQSMNVGQISRSSSAPLPNMMPFDPFDSTPLATTPANLQYPQTPGLLYCQDESLAEFINETVFRWRAQPIYSLDRSSSQVVSTKPKISIDVLRQSCYDRICAVGSAFPTSDTFPNREWAAILGAITFAAPALSSALSFMGYTSGKVNTEATDILQKGFRHPDAIVVDTTTMAVLFLITRAILNLDGSLTRVHEDGLLRILEMHGGLIRQNQQVTNTVLSIISLAAFTTNKQLTSYWAHHMSARGRASALEGHRGPYSPLLFTTAQCGMFLDPTACSERTQDVLRSARDLTGLAIELTSASASGDHSSGVESSTKTSQHLDTVKHSIQEIVSALLENAQIPHYGDYTFDACRTAATMYAVSIRNRVTLEEAAAIVSETTGYAASVQSLVYALQRTDVAGCWDNMCGVLLWIALVGGSASVDQQARSWLFEVAVNCSSVLLVENGDAVVDMYKTLLQVTSLWKEGGASVVA